MLKLVEISKLYREHRPKGISSLLNRVPVCTSYLMSDMVWDHVWEIGPHKLPYVDRCIRAKERQRHIFFSDARYSTPDQRVTKVRYTVTKTRTRINLLKHIPFFTVTERWLNAELNGTVKRMQLTKGETIGDGITRFTNTSIFKLSVGQ